MIEIKEGQCGGLDIKFEHREYLNMPSSKPVKMICYNGGKGYEQMKHAYKLGLKNANKGTTNCGAKLDMDDLKYIKEHYIRGNKREHSPHEIAKQLNQMKHREQEIRPICIYSVTQGRTYKKEYASL